MKVSIILAHPDPGSFNHAIAKKARETLERNGHDVVFHDLYQEGFDPVLTLEEIPKTASLGPVIQNHCEEIHNADGIIIIHPNWWGMPPAILKGWVDRVIRPGVAYEFLEGDGGEGVPCGRLLARTALVFNTSNTMPCESGITLAILCRGSGRTAFLVYAVSPIFTGGRSRLSLRVISCKELHGWMR